MSDRVLLTVSRIRLLADPSRYLWQQFNHHLLKPCEDEIVKRELFCTGRFAVDFQSLPKLFVTFCAGVLLVSLFFCHLRIVTAAATAQYPRRSRFWNLAVQASGQTAGHRHLSHNR